MNLSKLRPPYPVLNPAHDDISPATFDVECEASCDLQKYYFNYIAKIDHPDILAMIQNGTVKFCSHVDCDHIFFRHLEELSYPTGQFNLDCQFVQGRTHINFVLVVAASTSTYTPIGMHKDYRGFTFSLARGDLLATGPRFDFDLYPEYESLKNPTSIISIVADAKRKDGPARVNLSDKQKIIVELSISDFTSYDALRNHREAHSVLANMLVIPALMEALERVKAVETDEEEDTGEWQAKRWFRLLSKKVKDTGVDLQAADTMYEPAQALLMSPLARGLAGLEHLTE